MCINTLHKGNSGGGDDDNNNNNNKMHFLFTFCLRFDFTEQIPIP
jgi:hypothetical protein